MFLRVQEIHISPPTKLESERRADLEWIYYLTQVLSLGDTLVQPAALFLFVQCSVLGQVIETEHETHTLDRCYINERQSCFQLRANFKMIHVRQNDFFTYKTTDFVLEIVKHDLGYQRSRRVFLFKLPGEQATFASPMVSPTYTGKYLPGAPFFLPTARFFLLDSIPHLVLCDGKSCALFTYKEEVRYFVLQKTTNPRISVALKKLFAESFSPDDVYWTASLLQFGEFFGMRNISLKAGEPLDTNDLYVQWKRLLD